MLIFVLFSDKVSFLFMGGGGGGGGAVQESQSGKYKTFTVVHHVSHGTKTFLHFISNL